MKFWVPIFLILAMVGCSSCAYEPGGKTETAVEQSVDKFHDRLNQQQYAEIYAESASELRTRVAEPEFAAQLAGAHNQLGTVTSKADLFFDESFWAGIKRSFSGKRNRVTHGIIADGDDILANERFIWAVNVDQPRLVSYEFVGVICRKPCKRGFGYGLP